MKLYIWNFAAFFLLAAPWGGCMSDQTTPENSTDISAETQLFQQNAQERFAGIVETSNDLLTDDEDLEIGASEEEENQFFADELQLQTTNDNAGSNDNATDADTIDGLAHNWLKDMTDVAAEDVVSASNTPTKSLTLQTNSAGKKYYQYGTFTYAHHAADSEDYIIIKGSDVLTNMDDSGLKSIAFQVISNKTSDDTKTLKFGSLEYTLSTQKPQNPNKRYLQHIQLKIANSCTDATIVGENVAPCKEKIISSQKVANSAEGDKPAEAKKPPAKEKKSKADSSIKRINLQKFFRQFYSGILVFQKKQKDQPPAGAPAAP